MTTPPNVVLALTVKTRVSPALPRLAELAKSIAPLLLSSPKVTSPLTDTALANVREAEAPLASEEIIGEDGLPRASGPMPRAELLAANSVPSVSVVPPAYVLIPVIVRAAAPDLLMPPLATTSSKVTLAPVVNVRTAPWRSIPLLKPVLTGESVSPNVTVLATEALLANVRAGAAGKSGEESAPPLSPEAPLANDFALPAASDPSNRVVAPE